MSVPTAPKAPRTPARTPARIGVRAAQAHRFQARPATDPRPVMGLLLLSTDETLEQEARAWLPAGDAVVHSARVVSSDEVSAESLAGMAATLTPAAANLPAAPDYAVIGYGCTSATAVLGPARVAELVRAGRDCAAVTTPLDAVVAACESLGIRRLALLSPYVETVSEHLRLALAARAIDTPVFGSFDEPSEPAVVRISAASTIEAGTTLGQDQGAEALFLSCTNLPTAAALPELARRLQKPILSSNAALIWHMRRLAGLTEAPYHLP